jgi:hypothetical protein
MKFDATKNTCEDLCEPETQIYKPNPFDPSLAGTCEYCTGNCASCAGDVHLCTTCKAGFLLNLDSSCEETCEISENFPNSQTPIDGVCKECEKPCETCGESTSDCKTCIDDYKLFQGSKCIQYCPEKYENRDGICVLVGLVCPELFELNEGKDGCIPIEFDCP